MDWKKIILKQRRGLKYYWLWHGLLPLPRNIRFQCEVADGISFIFRINMSTSLNQTKEMFPFIQTAKPVSEEVKSMPIVFFLGQDGLKANVRATPCKAFQGNWTDTYENQCSFECISWQIFMLLSLKLCQQRKKRKKRWPLNNGERWKYTVRERAILLSSPFHRT